MYLFEIIIKKILEFRKKKTPLHPFNLEKQEETTEEECSEHIYLPIDSTKQILACKNCGHVIKNDSK